MKKAKKAIKAAYATQWEEVQLSAAKAWANLDIAVEMVEENKADLTPDEYAEVQAKIDEQQAYIQDVLIQGKAVYDEAAKAASQI